MQGGRWDLLDAGELIEHAPHADRETHPGQRREVARDPSFLFRHAVRDEQHLRRGVTDPRHRLRVVLRLRRPRMHAGDDQAGRAAAQLGGGALGDSRCRAEKEDRRVTLREMRHERVDEETPPELASDVIDKGMVLSGGGALLRNMDKLLTQVTGVACYVAENPLYCVAKGTGLALEHIDFFRRSLVAVR